MDTFKWIINDIENSLFITLIYKNSKLVSQFEAYSLVDISGNELLINSIRVNDLRNLITSSFVRFKSNCFSELLDNVYIDIPLRNVYMLYDNADIFMPLDNKMVLNNVVLPIDVIEAFSIMDGFIIGDNYGVKATMIKNKTLELDKLLNICKNYNKMDMDSQFYSLCEVKKLNDMPNFIDSRIMFNMK